MWYKIRAVWLRELIDAVRDKRTLYMMVLLPILIMPLMVLVGPVMMVRQQESAQETAPVAVVIGGEQIPGLDDWLVGGGLALDDAATTGATDDLETRLHDGDIDLIVHVPDDTARRLEAEQTVPFTLTYSTDRSRSMTASQLFETLLLSYGSEVAEARLDARGLSAELTRPFAIEERHNVAPEPQLAAQMLAMMVPYLIAVWAIAGGMYTAIDAAAGEKERNSLESLVMTPVPAAVIVVGKFLAIATVTMIAVLLLIGSMIVSIQYALPRLLANVDSFVAEMFGFTMTAGNVLLLVAVVGLFVAFMAAVQLGLSVYSKTFREAQAYMTGLMFVVMLPGMYLMFMEELGASLWVYAVPVVNVLLVSRQLLEGAVGALPLLLTFVSLAAAAAVALWITLRVFRHERVLFRA